MVVHYEIDTILKHIGDLIDKEKQSTFEYNSTLEEVNKGISEGNKKREEDALSLFSSLSEEIAKYSCETLENVFTKRVTKTFTHHKTHWLFGRSTELFEWSEVVISGDLSLAKPCNNIVAIRLADLHIASNFVELKRLKLQSQCWSVEKEQVVDFKECILLGYFPPPKEKFKVGKVLQVGDLLELRERIVKVKNQGAEKVTLGGDDLNILSEYS